jgi:KEOPS complex subunit Cgi121
MLHYLREFREYVEITGYRNISFRKAEAYLKATRKQTQQDLSIQFFDADTIATQEHLYFASLNALQAFMNKTNISKSPAMETMLYAAAQRQIQRAINRSGIKPQTLNMAVTIIGGNPRSIESSLGEISKCVNSQPDESVLEITCDKKKKIKQIFEITDEELRTIEPDDEKNSLTRLVIERVALLSTQF